MHSTKLSDCAVGIYYNFIAIFRAFRGGFTQSDLMHMMHVIKLSDCAVIILSIWLFPDFYQDSLVTGDFKGDSA